MVRAGAPAIYVSMFDEFNEGNQIVKTAESQAWMPTDSGLLALDEDGTACSSDYYLRLTGDGGRMLKKQIALTATRPTQPMVGGTTPPPTATVISLRARANNMYVCADNAGAASLIANRTAIGPWETFDVLDAGGGNIAFRSHANSQIVCAENAGASALIANRTAVGSWETFQLVHNSDGTVSLRSLANNNYVTAGTAALIANSTTIGTAQRFDLVND
jgi:hypothetical protein